MEISEHSLSPVAQMLHHTNSYLDDHISVWVAVPIISSYKNRIHELVLSFHDIEKNGSVETYSGQAILQLKQQIANKMDILDDTLEAYAEDIEDHKLKQAAENHYSDYYSLPYDQFVDKVTEIIELLELHVGSMSDYGLVQDQINDVKLNLEEYQISLNKPVTYNLHKEITSQSIDSLVEEALHYAEKLDSVMKRFKRSHTTFYNGYLVARSLQPVLHEYA